MVVSVAEVLRREMHPRVVMQGFNCSNLGANPAVRENRSSEHLPGAFYSLLVSTIASSRMGLTISMIRLRCSSPGKDV